VSLYINNLHLQGCTTFKQRFQLMIPGESRSVPKCLSSLHEKEENVSNRPKKNHETQGSLFSHTETYPSISRTRPGEWFDDPDLCTKCSIRTAPMRYINPPNKQIVTKKNTHFCSSVQRRRWMNGYLSIWPPLSRSVSLESDWSEFQFLSLMANSDGGEEVILRIDTRES